jgi:hypothetical protein
VGWTKLASKKSFGSLIPNWNRTQIPIPHLLFRWPEQMLFVEKHDIKDVLKQIPNYTWFKDRFYLINVTLN